MLYQGPKAWNAWRAANPNIVPELSEIQLTLHQRQLGPSTGGPIDLHSADLERASLRYATLTGADLEGARLNGADLTHARLDGAKLAGANLTEALLDHADLTGAFLDQAVLFGADLSNTRNLTASQLETAYGDASTRLPATVAPPANWFPSASAEDFDKEYLGWDAEDELGEQDLYEVLGVTRDASNEDIRAAYRTLVKKFHPDLNPGDKAAQERFKSVAIANKILTDPEQRARYDRGEIDAQGRVDHDYEARRNFRKTAFRYSVAAVASFLLAAGTLFAVWRTVLSPGFETVATPQVAALSQSKRGERLSETPEPPAPKPALESSGEDNSPDAGETAPPAEEAQKPLAAPAIEKTVQPESQAQPSALPLEATADSARLAPSQPGIVAERLDSNGAAAGKSAQPPASEPPAPPDGASPQTPHGNPPAANTAPAEPVLDVPRAAATPPAPPPVEEAAAAAASPAAQQNRVEHTNRPLRELHKILAGQTPLSAPDPWSVAAITPASPQALSQIEPRPQPRESLQGHAAPAGKLQYGPRRGAPNDVVSKVLRARAIRRGLGKKAAPVVARAASREAGRSAAAPDFPTNALGSKPKAQAGPAAQPTVKRKAAVLDRHQQPGSSPADADTAIAAPPVVLAPPREARHHQAVSDILSGGL